jgi:hypothetical protein
MGELVGLVYASLFGFLMPLIFFVIALYAAKRREEMASRERLAAVERGIPPALMQRPRHRQRASPLAGALVLLAAGVGLSFALWQSGASEWGWGALPALIGAALLIHWRTGGGASWQRQQALNEELQRAYIDLVRRTEPGFRPGVAPPAAPAPDLSAPAPANRPL